MSKPRYDWWPYAKGMIRRYPELCSEYRDLHTVSATQNYASDGCASGGVNRTVESIAIRELPSTRQREYEAVRRAITTTSRYRNGADRLKVIDMALWKRSHTLEGAALMIPCSVRHAKEWHGLFIRLVASNFGLMDD